MKDISGEAFEIDPGTAAEIAHRRRVERELTKRWLKLGNARKRKLRSKGVTLIAVHPHYAVDLCADETDRKKQRNARKRKQRKAR